MAEENNQDLSMEDILSSIKDILTEDEQKNAPAGMTETPAAQTVTPAAAVAEPQIEAEAEDILELSPSMRIEEEPLTEAEEINLDAELDNIGADIETLTSAAAEPLPEENGDQEEAAVFNPEDILNELPQLTEDKDLDSDPFDTEAFVAAGPEAVSPFAALETEAPEPAAGTGWNQWNEPEDLTEETIETTAEILPEETIIEPAAADNRMTEEDFEPAPLATEIFAETEPVAAPEPDMPAAAPTENEAQTDPADVSAAIISNFAKMFSAQPETVAAAPAPTEEEPVSLIDRGGRTIEDVVADVIRGIIGEEVAQNWRQGADYETLAREEIKTQTRAWLDSNLPAMVEKIVRAEIERVMAKVGS